MVSLKDNTLEGQIETSIANFGLIPYGHSIVGRLYFDKSNQYGCDKFESITDKDN